MSVLSYALVPRASYEEIDVEPWKLYTLPNAITIAGFACTLAWLAGASAWFAIAGLVADEVDGRLARATGTTSEVGAELDFGTDIIASALILARLGHPLLIAPLAVTQIALRDSGYRPTIGSARAILTLYAVGTGGLPPP